MRSEHFIVFRTMILEDNDGGRTCRILYSLACKAHQTFERVTRRVSGGGFEEKAQIRQSGRVDLPWNVWLACMSCELAYAGSPRESVSQEGGCCSMTNKAGSRDRQHRFSGFDLLVARGPQVVVRHLCTLRSSSPSRYRV